MSNREDADEMSHKGAFNQGLYCWLTLKQSSGTEIHGFKEILNGKLLKTKQTTPYLFNQTI